MADEGGVEQMLINLVVNARDAMPDGGLIEISTGVATFDAAAALSNPEARVGRFVCLNVADHGCGMTSQVLARIFDPFFTTKEVGKGTGLGLSTLHGIVKQHEGWIEVVSESGRGAQFRIYLPACGAPAPAKAPLNSHKPLTAESGKGELILVVEDEMAVRELASAALKKRGYQVLNAADGPEAIGVWEQSTTPVQLLLTDMVMPNGMTGGELAKKLQARNPAMQVIYTSGYSPEILRRDSLLTQGINFLPKPYDLQTLLDAVRTCLDGGKLTQYQFHAGHAEPAIAAH